MGRLGAVLADTGCGRAESPPGWRTLGTELVAGYWALELEPEAEAVGACSSLIWGAKSRGDNCWPWGLMPDMWSSSSWAAAGEKGPAEEPAPGTGAVPLLLALPPVCRRTGGNGCDWFMALEVLEVEGLEAWAAERSWSWAWDRSWTAGWSARCTLQTARCKVQGATCGSR